MKEKNTAPGLWEKISYGMGDFAQNGLYTLISTYLMFYYTDTVGLSLEMIGIILLIGRVVDAVCSPIMGVIVDKTSTKYGKCRPYIALGIIPVCILLMIMFSTPQGMSERGKVALAIGTYALYSVMFAMINVPYATLINVVTDEHQHRVDFNMFKNIGSNLGAIMVTSVTLTFVAALSGNGNGFSKTAMIFGVLFLITNMMCAVFTKERLQGQKGKAVKLGESLKVLGQNHPWMLLCGVQFLTLMMLTSRNQGIIYYAKYCLGNETISSWMMTITSVIAVLMSVLLPILIRRHGMKFCVVAGNVLWCIAMCGSWFAGKNVIWILVFHILASIGWGIATGGIFVQLTQTIDYAQWKTGKRPQGLFTSLLSAVQKLGGAVAGMLCSQILNLGGYVANAVATEQVMLSIRVLFCGLPCALGLGVIGIMCFYRLDKLYPQIEKELSGSLCEEGRKL